MLDYTILYATRPYSNPVPIFRTRVITSTTVVNSTITTMEEA